MEEEVEAELQQFEFGIITGEGGKIVTLDFYLRICGCHLCVVAVHNAASEISDVYTARDCCRKIVRRKERERKQSL